MAALSDRPEGMDSDDWRDYRKAQQERRAARLPRRTSSIMDLKAEGYLVEELTPYQFRINKTIDVYPVHNRWHDIPLNRRGESKNLNAFIRRRLRPYYTRAEQ